MFRKTSCKHPGIPPCIFAGLPATGLSVPVLAQSVPFPTPSNITPGINTCSSGTTAALQDSPKVKALRAGSHEGAGLRCAYRGPD